YTSLGFTHVGGGGGETMPAGMLDLTGKNAVVDWVMVEVRDKTDPTQVLATKCALMQRDGDVVGVDGYDRLVFNLAQDSFHIAVRHRNHLAVMSAAHVQMSKAVAALDLIRTSTTVFGSEARKQVG